MINELFRLRQSIKAWGFDVPDIGHQSFPKNPKNGKSYKVFVNQRGLVRVEEFPGFPQFNFYEYVYNKKRGLSFKITRDNPKNIAGHLEATIKLAELMDDNPTFEPLQRLAKALKKMDVDTFIKDLLNEIPKEEDSKKVEYVSLEVATGTTVQTLDMMNAVALRLNELDKDKQGSGLDDLGNPGAISKNFKIESPFRLFFYSRNEDSPCYSRWGLNATDACRIGTETHRQVVQLLSWVLDPARKARRIKNEKGKFEDTSGIWYQYIADSRNCLVISTLSPSFPEFQDMDEEDLGEETWEGYAKKVVDALLAKSDADPSAMGNVIIIQLNKGASSLRYSLDVGLPTIAEKYRRWADGIYNGGSARWTPLKEVVRLIGCQYLRNQRGYYERKTTCHFNIEDGYGLLFDNPQSIDMALMLFVENTCRKMFSFTLEQVKQVQPVLNLLLHKKGFVYNRETESMDHWAFYLGKMLQTANWLHEIYLQDRTLEHSNLVGQRYLANCFENPKSGYPSFCENFFTYLMDAERNNPGAAARYHTLSAKFTELLNGQDLPSRPSLEERALIAQGYSHYVPKVKTEEKKSETESESKE